jgi:hypothetical protein
MKRRAGLLKARLFLFPNEISTAIRKEMGKEGVFAMLK